MTENACFEKKGMKQAQKLFADGVVDPDLQDEKLCAMYSIRNEFGEIAKKYCEEAFLDAFNTNQIGRCLTADSPLKTVGVVSELKTHVKSLVDRKEKLKKARIDFP